MELSLLVALAAAAAVINSGLTVWNFVQSPSTKNKKELDRMGEEVDGIDRRLQVVEGELRHLPDKDAVNDLKLAIAELKGSVGRMDEQIGSVGRTVHRIDDYLRSEKRQ